MEWVVQHLYYSFLGKQRMVRYIESGSKKSVMEVLYLVILNGCPGWLLAPQSTPQSQHFQVQNRHQLPATA